MNRTFSIEFYKRRHLLIWTLPVIFAVLLFLWQTLGAKDRLDLGYTYRFYQLPLLNCLIMPTFLAVIASRCCDMEIKGDTMKLLYTMQSKHVFYNMKFLHEALYLLLFVLLETLTIPASGLIWHFTETLSLSSLGLFALTAFSVGLVILSFQHFLSLYCPNQITPLFTGLAGSFAGLFSLYLPEQFSLWVPWRYFAAFIPVEMHWEETTRNMWFTPVPFPVTRFVLFITFGILLCFIFQSAFIKKEV